MIPIYERGDYESLVTFEDNKRTPVHNWFYYKEGYSNKIISKLACDLVKENIIDLKIPTGSKGSKKRPILLDPFCGTGTTVLAGIDMGFNAIGFDITPLSVFVTKVKTQRYDILALKKAADMIVHLKFKKPAIKWQKLKIVDINRAFNKYAREDMLFLKENIEKFYMDGYFDEKARDFLMLALISIVPEVSNTVKDGGFLRIVKKRHTPPVRHKFKQKLKKMIRNFNNPQSMEFQDNLQDNLQGNLPEALVDLADARSLPLADESVDLVITSPPYLNMVDYTKIYVIESSLISNLTEIEKARSLSVRSSLGSDYNVKDSAIKSTVEKIIKDTSGYDFRLRSQTGVSGTIVGYFEDMYIAAGQMYRVLKKGGAACIVIGNSCFPEGVINCDEVLAATGEELGFDVVGIWSAKKRVCPRGAVRDTARESIVILKK